MAKFDTSVKPKKQSPLTLPRWVVQSVGIGFIALSIIIASLSVYEAVLGGGKVRVVTLPGFHELKLDAAGLYAGIYQHRSTGPLPIKELAAMDVRIMSKDDYEEIPVLMNSSGQTFNRMGMQGLPLFNFAIQRAGSYTLSGVYTGNTQGPTVQVLLIPQAAQNIKQTILVGGGFFILFLTLGIIILVRLNHWMPKPATKK